MSKPLLTDDVIEQAKRGEIDLEDHPYYQDYEEEFYDEDYEANYQPLHTRAAGLRMLNVINFSTSLIAFSFGLSSS